MPLQRLGIVNPEANLTTPLASFSAEHLVSVTVANKATVKTPLTKISIWVVPANATIEVQYAYICFNLEVDLGQSFETFRFAVNAGDSLYVRSSTDTTSFSCNGILQEDSILPQNLAQTFTNKFIRGIDNTIYLDKGPLAERRLNVEEGYVRYNTEFKKLEVKTDTNWEVVGVDSYTPTNSADWNTIPTTISGALDEIAARLRSLEP